MSDAPLYPVFIDLADRPCLVVGGGPVATEKTEKLVDAGADVRIISLTFTDEIRQMVADGQIRQADERGYRSADLDGCLLVIAATNDPEVNRQVWGDGEARRMLVNVVDVPELCNFIVPSIMRHGELAIAVSTGGASPVVARTLRQKIEETVGPEWGELVALFRDTREQLKARYLTMPERAAAVEAFLASDVLERLARGDRAGAADLFAELLGTPVSR